MKRTAIYTRISQDPKFTGLGVERQLEDCRALAKRLKLKVVVEYSDNHLSAFKDTVRRPGYEALLDDIRNERIDVVVAYKSDRLSRRLRQTIELFELLLEHHVTVQTTSGETDLTTANGIAMAQMAAVMAENYIRTNRENNKRMRLQIAQKGGRHKCGRVYGWEDDGIQVREPEAAVVREMVDRIINGQSPTSIAASLNDRNIPTVRGARWQGLAVRKCAERASNAGLREHLGEIYPGNWEPILSQEVWEDALLAIKARTGMKFKRGVGRKYMLTGFAYCGHCGNKLSATAGGSRGISTYRCHKAKSSDTSNITGCGGVSRNIAPLEDLISEAVLMRLDSPALADSINQQEDQREEVAGLLKAVQTQQLQLQELVADYYTNKLLTRAQFLSAKSTAEANLEALTRKLNDMTSRRTIKLDLKGTLRETWDKASIEWKRSIIELLIDKVLVFPKDVHAPRPHYKQWHFSPALIKIEWRV